MTEKLQAARSLSAPRRKFAFKKSETQKNSSREHTANSAAQAPKTPSGSYDARSELSKNSSEVSEPGFRADSAGSPSVFDLFSLSSQCYILPESALKPAASIRNVDHSFIDLSISAKLARPFSTLAIKGASKSLLIGTRVSGAAHITGVENSTLVVWSRQVRMHDCKDCVLYLRCSSRPIIEDCSGMKFAPLPDFIVC